MWAPVPQRVRVRTCIHTLVHVHALPACVCRMRRSIHGHSYSSLPVKEVKVSQDVDPRIILVR